jgi:type I site-specific restriction-modification system R (restriction) subunit
MAGIDLLKYVDHIEVSTRDKQNYVFDIIRRKEVVLLPEELVRQCTLHYLTKELGISKNLIRVEKGIKVNGLFRRCDILVYDRNALPILIIECKKPSQDLTQKVFNQIAMYNIPLQVPFLMLTNGASNYFCEIDFVNNSYQFMEMLPSYEKMLKKG